MATTRYGADAVGNYETANNVTVKQGVSDPWQANALKIFAGAVEGGYNIYAKSKEEEFKAGVTDIVQQETGVTTKNAFDVPTTDAELKQFESTTQRALQASAQSGRTTAQRIALRLERQQMDAITKRPWLADNYREVGKKVLGDYAATIDVLSQIETKAMAEKAAGGSAADKEVKYLYDKSAEYGYELPQPPENMTQEQRIETKMAINNLGYLKRTQAEQRAKRDDLLKKEEALRAQRNEARAIRGEARTERESALLLEERELKKESKDNRFQLVKDWMPVLGDMQIRFGKQLAEAKGDAAKIRIITEQARQYADQLRVQASGSLANSYLDNEDASAFRETINAEIEGFFSNFSGDMSWTSTGQRVFEQMRRDFQMSSPDIFAARSQFGDALLEPVIQRASYNLPDGTQNKIDAAVLRTLGEVAAGRTGGVAPDQLKNLSEVQLNWLKEAKPGTTVLSEFKQRPLAYANTFLTMVPNLNDAKGVRTLTEEVAPGLAEVFPSIDAESPEKGRAVASEFVNFGQNYGAGVIQQLSKKPEIEQALGWDSRMGQFTVDSTALTPPDKRAAEGLVLQMNHTVRAIMAMEKYTGKESGVSSAAWAAHLLGFDLAGLVNAPPEKK